MTTEKETSVMDAFPDGWFDIRDALAYRELANQIPDGGTICELGVWLGRSLCSIGDIIKMKHLKVVAIDTFEGSLCDAGMQDDAKTRDIQQLFKDNLKSFGIEADVYKLTTTEASKLFADKTFDLVFIDADHSYEAAKEDIKNWLPKTKGFIAGHDYYTWEGVTKAVNEAFGTVEHFGSVWCVDVISK